MWCECSCDVRLCSLHSAHARKSQQLQQRTPGGVLAIVSVDCQSLLALPLIPTLTHSLFLPSFPSHFTSSSPSVKTYKHDLCAGTLQHLLTLYSFLSFIFRSSPSGKTYKHELCAGTHQRGLAIVGDSVTAHFRIPPRWLGTFCVVFVLVFVDMRCGMQRYVTRSFRAAPERVHKSHFRSLCNVTFHNIIDPDYYNSHSFDGLKLLVGDTEDWPECSWGTGHSTATK
jgi:hypothetical protein